MWWIVEQKIVCEQTNKQEKIQENDMYQMCFFGQPHNPQNQHRKSQQDQVMKKWNTKSQIRVCI
jgi:hypothetical protein